MQKNQQAMAIAIRRAVAKSKKIKELGINPSMTIEEQDALVLQLAAKKVSETKTEKEAIKGQEWYISDLIKFSALSGQERIDREYSEAFPEVATEDEGLDLVLSYMDGDEAAA